MFFCWNLNLTYVQKKKKIIQKSHYSYSSYFTNLTPGLIVWFTGTKLSQAKKFNDPDDACKILVATDAIGMGLNL